MNLGWICQIQMIVFRWDQLLYLLYISTTIPVVLKNNNLPREVTRRRAGVPSFPTHTTVRLSNATKVLQYKPHLVNVYSNVIILIGSTISYNL